MKVPGCEAPTPFAAVSGRHLATDGGYVADDVDDVCDTPTEPYQFRSARTG